MTLLNTIDKNIQEAIKTGESVHLSVLRGLKAALHNKEIELRSQKKEITEEIIIEIVQKEAKKRREAAEMYKKGEREELAEKEEKELVILNEYLPEQLSDDKVKELVIKAIKTLNPVGQQDFGRVMGKVMAETKGQVQGNKVKKIVQEQLNNFNHGQKK